MMTGMHILKIKHTYQEIVDDSLRLAKLKRQMNDKDVKMLYWAAYQQNKIYLPRKIASCPCFSPFILHLGVHNKTCHYVRNM